MKLYGFTFLRNESKMLPYVKPYWDAMGYDKLVVYDNESTDNSVELLKQIPYVEVRSFHTDTFSEKKIIDLKLGFYAEVYQEYVETKEDIWVSFCDFDEVLFFDGIGRCSGKGVLEGNRINYYNCFDGKMIELLCDENTVPNKGKMAHTWKNIRGKYWHVYGNKPLLIKISDFPYIVFSWGNHEVGYTIKDGVELRHLQETGYVYGFHLKWIDMDLLKERSLDMLKRNTTVKFTPEMIDRYYEESLLPLSFPLKDYFLLEGSKMAKIGGMYEV